MNKPGREEVGDGKQEGQESEGHREEMVDGVGSRGGVPSPEDPILDAGAEGVREEAAADWERRGRRTTGLLGRGSLFLFHVEEQIWKGRPRTNGQKRRRGRPV